jgi:nitronate monooxygenase
MWPKTRITTILNIDLPIIQAPMAGASTFALAAAVSNAGGLGSLACGYMQPDAMQDLIQKTRSLTNKPIAVNLFVPEKHTASPKQMQRMQTTLKSICKNTIKEFEPISPPFIPAFDEQLHIIIDEKIPILSFTFGCLSDAWIKKLKRQKILLLGTATTAAEAILLERKQIDIIVAQGYEAGAHRGSFLKNADASLLGNFALIPQITDHISIPVIAAGGIMDARGILAAMLLGASGVQMGPAFLTTRESAAHPLYKNALLSLSEDNTTLTNAFSGKLARAIRNKFTDTMENFQDQILDYPIQNTLTRQIRDLAAKKNLPQYLSLYAGQNSYLCREINAKNLIRFLDKDVKRLLKKIS